MKSVLIKVVKSFEFTAVVPDEMPVDALQEVAETVADTEFDELEIGWEVTLGKADLISALPADEEELEGLVVLSDKGDDFVQPEDADWWKTAH